MGSKQSFGGPAPIGSAIAPEVLSRSSSFGSTSVIARRAVPNSVSDSHFTHMEINKDSKDDSSKPLSLAEKKLQRLARSRATASVSRYTGMLVPISIGVEKNMHLQFHVYCRSRKREHLHSLQTRLSALEQENKDLIQQIAVRDAELKRFKQERGEPEGECTFMLFVSASVSISAQLLRTTGYHYGLSFCPTIWQACSLPSLHIQFQAPQTRHTCCQHTIAPVYVPITA